MEGNFQDMDCVVHSQSMVSMYITKSTSMDWLGGLLFPAFRKL